MSKAISRSPRALSTAVALSLCGLALASSLAVAAEVINLRSGNAAIGNADPQINALVGLGATPLSASLFTAADFAAACGPRSAVVIAPHPAWLAQLACDPLAQWIGTDAVASPASALYCQPFDVQTCCIESAVLTFCWAGDDALGDGIYGGPNLDGVYINGVAVTPSINTGSYAAQTTAGPLDVTALLHCGSNQLQVYNRDAAILVSGVIYSAVIDITECAVPTESNSFSNVKSLYR
jgi:hypothetical protein